ncbi:iron-sulfur cluster biosynthesis family protein [Niallia sp. 01092]|uniref:iron-sulfur cluster biosynthesis family protein n=1 Tax=unclassified Niallia TaxID=2837522 RepID=UPI003FD0EF9A
MILRLTDSALNELKKMVLKEEQLPRIDANVAGGCGMSVKFSLIFDESRRNDTVIEYDSIQIQIDHFTKRYLDGETQIDYKDDVGFLIGESYASSACSIEFD